MRYVLLLGGLIYTGLANPAGGTLMPWDTGLQVFLASITGPVAGGIALVSIVLGGVSLLTGGEWSMHRTRADKLAHQSSTVLGHSFAKPMFVVLLCLGVLLGAVQIVALLGFGAGALLPVEYMPGA